MELTQHILKRNSKTQATKELGRQLDDALTVSRPRWFCSFWAITYNPLQRNENGFPLGAAHAPAPMALSAQLNGLLPMDFHGAAFPLP